MKPKTLNRLQKLLFTKIATESKRNSVLIWVLVRLENLSLVRGSLGYVEGYVALFRILSLKILRKIHEKCFYMLVF